MSRFGDHTPTLLALALVLLAACDPDAAAPEELLGFRDGSKQLPPYPAIRLNDHAQTMLGSGTPGTGYDFVVIGDPEPKQNPIPNTSISQIFRDTLAEIAVHAQTEHVDFVIVVGDLVSGGQHPKYQEYYDEVKVWMDTHQIPVFSVMGNHDTDVVEGFSHYRGFISASEDFYFDYEDARFIGFNNTRIEGEPAWPEEFGLRIDRVNQLDEWLSNAPADRFVYTHIPFHEQAGVSYLSFGANLHCDNERSEAGFRDFHNLFEKHDVRASFAGHVHWYHHEQLDGINYFTTGGVGGGVEADLQGWPGFVIDPADNVVREKHWMSVEVAADSRMTTKVHLLGLGPNDPIHNTQYTPSDFDEDLGLFTPAHPTIDVTSRWLKSSSNNGDGALATWAYDPQDGLEFGDFDGDGRDEMFLTNTHPGGPWMAVKRLDPVAGRWDWVWNNAGDTTHDLYPYRERVVVGDFDGDERDELLGDGPSWTTMFHFDGGDWQWGWSDYGDDSHPLYPYKGGLLAGDFDGDQRDDLLGAGPGWTTMFHFDGVDWQWGWSDYGNSSHPLYPYKEGLLPGDFDGDGRTDLLGIVGSNAALFEYQNSDFVETWSNGGSGWIGGWNLGGAQRCLANNFEATNATDELLCLSTGQLASWAAISTLKDDGSGWIWGWSANPVDSTPYLGDWSISDHGGEDTRYWSFTLEGNSARAGLLASRVDWCGNRYFDSYAKN